MRVVIDGMAWLPKSDMSQADLILLKRRLTLIPKATSEYKSPSPIQLFAEKDMSIGVPREYFFAMASQKHEIIDETSMGHPMNENISRISLRQDQKPHVYTVLNHYKTKYGCCFQGETGFGKTIIGLAIARRLGLSTLVMVHKGTLLNQWRAKILGDPKSDNELLRRGFLPEASVGYAGEGKLDYKGKDFVIGTVQTLCDKDLPEDFFRYFGFIIGDEIHRLGSEKWSKAIPRFHAHYRLGLSATPRRKDNAENAFFYHLGPIVSVGKGYVLEPKIYCVETNYRLVDTPAFNPDRIKSHELLVCLSESDYRNKIIVTEILSALKTKRRVLCIADRVLHLKKLMALLENMMAQEKVFFTVGSFFKGGERKKQDELDEAKSKECVFATYKMMEDGEDVPELDTLFMATPVSDPEQVVGRIIRRSPNKKTAMVVDFVDSQVSKCASKYRSRLKYYLSKKWKVYAITRG